MFLHSWVLFPLVAFVLSVGAGLLVDRITDRPLPGALIAPVGFALIVVVATFLTWQKATAPLAAWALVAVAIAGFVAGRGRLVASTRRARRAIWPAVAALLPAGMMSLPVLMTGKPGFTGYGRIVDLAYQIVWAGYMQSGGQGKPGDIGSSYLVVADKLAAIHYPAGGQAALGAIGRVAGLDLLWAWQPFMAGIGAVLGLALFVLLRPAIPDARMRAIAAGIAAQPSILFAYGMTSGIKELGGAALILLAAALLMLHRPGDGGLRRAVPLSIALAAAVSAFSVGAIPWIGMFAVLVFIAELVRRRARRMRVIGMWAWTTLLAAALALPAVVSGVTIAQIATAGGPEGLGNLAAPVPAWSAAGVWITSDYRFPLGKSGYETVTIIGIALVLVLAIVALVWSIRRRLLVYVALDVAGVVALAYVARASATWSDFKAITVTAPFILTLGFAGAGVLGLWRRSLGIAAGALVVVGVLAGNVLFYHSTTLAPYDRLHDLQQVAERYEGQGPSLYPVFEEYGEYILRDVRGSSLSNPANFDPGWGPNALPGLQFVRDPDEYTQKYMHSLRTIILRRDPTASRPPGDWRPVETTRFHQIWQRDLNAPRILAHVGMRGGPRDRTRSQTPEGGQTLEPTCTTLGKALRDAPDGARVRYATQPQLTQLNHPDFVSRGFLPQPPDWNARTPGRLAGSLALPVTGRYSIWLRGSIGRRVRVYVDGRPVGSERWQEAYPGNYMLLDTRDLTKGAHTIEVRRGGGRSILPGVGNDIGTGSALALIGPVAFLPAGQERIVDVPRDRAMALCRDGHTLIDWMEVVAPS
jgi:hypothetical protein